jgi:excisionase family DNA binding protein
MPLARKFSRRLPDSSGPSALREVSQQEQAGVEIPSRSNPAWLSVTQLCRRWQLGRRTIYKFIDSRVLPAWKVGAHLYRISVADVLQFEARNAVQSAQRDDQYTKHRQRGGLRSSTLVPSEGTLDRRREWTPALRAPMFYGTGDAGAVPKLHQNAAGIRLLREELDPDVGDHTRLLRGDARRLHSHQPLTATRDHAARWQHQREWIRRSRDCRCPSRIVIDEARWRRVERNSIACHASSPSSGRCATAAA